MSESPIYHPFRENEAEANGPRRPPASRESTAGGCVLATVRLKVAEDGPRAEASGPRQPPASRESTAGGCVLATVTLKVAEDGPLALAPPLARQISSARFGAPSHSSFFCRHNPHPQRVHPFRGGFDKPICMVNDVTFGQTPQYCLGRVMTPRVRGLWLQYKNTPAAAIGTNSPCLPLDVLTGLQMFPLRLADSPCLKLLTEAWRDLLQYLTERVGLVRPATKGSSVVSSSPPQPSAASSPSPPCSAVGLGGSRDSDGTVKLQLMVRFSPTPTTLVVIWSRRLSFLLCQDTALCSKYVDIVVTKVIDMLCQILQTESISVVQTWLLTAGQREKEQVINLLCVALAKAPVSDPPDPPSPPEAEQLTVREVHNTPLTPCREDTSRDQASELKSNTDSGLQTEDSGLERARSARAESRTPRTRLNISRVSKTPQRTLGSPSVCHLNQKVVLRYTNRPQATLTPTPTPSAIFQAEWPNYAQQLPNSTIS